MNIVEELVLDVTIPNCGLMLVKDLMDFLTENNVATQTNIRKR